MRQISLAAYGTCVDPIMEKVDFLKVLLNFFSGAQLVALLKGLFIPVWRQIHRSKIQPVTSWQLTNSRATGFCHEVI